jgi:predicted SprT family Zn-dependent metalloprotease
MLSILVEGKTITEDPQLLARMIFSQLISTMEAYLSDTLIHYTLQDKIRMLNLLSTDRNLLQEKLTLIEVLKNENVVQISVKKYLRSILYHNLERVRFLYKNSLGFEIIPNDKDWKLLLTAVNHRHDCVHRNGVTVDGQPNRIFTKAYVRRVAEAIGSLARHVAREADRIDTDMVL